MARILEQLNSAWDVLRDHDAERVLGVPRRARPVLGLPVVPVPHASSSSLGNERARCCEPHAHRPDLCRRARGRARAPSLYDEALRLLARRGLRASPEAVLERDVSQPYAPSPSGAGAPGSTVYRDPEAHWELYELAEKLVDLEDYFRRWRFSHVTTVERVIGFKRGTGGTGGVSYLQAHARRSSSSPSSGTCGPSS